MKGGKMALLVLLGLLVTLKHQPAPNVMEDTCLPCTQRNSNNVLELMKTATKKQKSVSKKLASLRGALLLR